MLTRRPLQALLESLAFLPALASLLLLHLGTFFTWGAPMDEGVYLVYPRLLDLGMVAHRDFQTFYGPANLWVLQGVYWLVGPSIGAERMTGVCYELVLLAAIYALLRAWGRVAAGVGALVVALMIGALSFGAYPLIAATGLAVWSLFLLSRRLRSGWPRAPLFAGVVGGLASAFRPEIALVVLVGAAITLFDDPRGRWRFALGMVGGLLPFGLHVLAAGPGSVYNTLVIDAVVRSGPGRRLPLLGQPIHVEALLIFLVGGAVLVAAAGARGMRLDSPDRGGARVQLAAGAVSVALLPESLARLDYFHAALAGALTAAFLGAIAVDGLRRAVQVGASGRVRAIEVGILAALLAVVPVASVKAFAVPAVAHLSQPTRTDHAVAHAGREWPVQSAAEAVEIERTLTAVDNLSHPGQRLFVGPHDMRRTNFNDSFFYFLLPQLRVATYYVEMEPLTANRADSRLASDVMSADILLLTRRYDATTEPNASQDFGSDEPNRVVASQFCSRFGSPDFEVFTRC